MSHFPVLSSLTLVPFLGALIVLGLGGERKALARWLALGVSLTCMLFVAALWGRFDTASGTMQFEELAAWMPSLGVGYHLGIDGLGLLMVALTALVVPIGMLASWHIQERVPLYFGLILFLQAGLFGTFTALNFFHWFLFWELSLVPAFFLIRLWGGPGRSHAATQFFLYTMVGSVALLLAFLAIYLATEKSDFTELAELGRNGTLASALAEKLGWYHLTARRVVLVIFAGAFLGFAVKVPLVPFHTWLPVAYAEAPTGTTILLTGLMSKMGVYGFLRVLLPLFAEQMRWVLTPLLWLTVLSILFSAYAALAQRDLKRILAYSSVNHLGYCLLGLVAATGTGSLAVVPEVEKAAALQGVFLQMFNHGLTAAALFWFVDMLESRSGGARGVDDFGGLRAVAPVFCGLMGIALFSSLGLPGLNGFIGEFLIFKGVFALATWAAALAVLGLLVTAIFILTLSQKVFHGPLNPNWTKLPDLTLTERVLVAPVIALLFLLGVYPQAVLGTINGTVLELVRHLGP